MRTPHQRFLSTLSLRRATEHTNNGRNANLDFYPRSPCGERRARRASRQQPAGISIHALLAESDAVVDNIVFVPGQFLSTLSLRRATSARPETRPFCAISIHALLAESDGKKSHKRIRPDRFLSTLSLRRATANQTNLPGSN